MSINSERENRLIRISLLNAICFSLAILLQMPILSTRFHEAYARETTVDDKENSSVHINTLMAGQNYKTTKIEFISGKTIMLNECEYKNGSIVYQMQPYNRYGNQYGTYQLDMIKKISTPTATRLKEGIIGGIIIGTFLYMFIKPHYDRESRQGVWGYKMVPENGNGPLERTYYPGRKKRELGLLAGAGIIIGTTGITAIIGSRIKVGWKILFER